jgi:glutamyl-Q tRNA(Asp) synthetase
VAAVGSYLQAKINDGEWLVRMEDVDTTRKVAGADVEILKTLEAFGFEWHGDVVYQSQRNNLYQQVLEQLIEQSLVFPCRCSRKQLASSHNISSNNTGPDKTIYPGTCRHRTLPEPKEHSLRLLANDVTIKFDDKIMGHQSQDIQTQCGDFVIKRRDGLFAYQLAVVVDDAAQGISEIVRGADLLDNTARQIYLQHILNLPTPAYCHLPLAVDSAGNKISKSEGAASVDIAHREQQLIHALDFLGQQPPDELMTCNTNDIWQWAIEHWKLAHVPTDNSHPL